jgi:hypothetical protein
MEIDRRRALKLATVAMVAAAPLGHARASGTAVAFAAARVSHDGAASLALLSATGEELHAIDLPARAHDATFCPLTRTCVVFARRPGTFAVAFTPDGRTRQFKAPADRHFYGHGVFAADGRLLYATENDFEAGRGVIGIYDVDLGYHRIGELDSGGIGPHDIALIPGSPLLAVANGGLREHPDFGEGRRILNPQNVESSLAYVDTRTGDVLERHVLASGADISWRHLDVAADGTVVAGAQLLRPGDGANVLLRHRRQQPPRVLALDAEDARLMAGYVSSLAVDPDGANVAVTSSRGSAALVLDLATGRKIASCRAVDVSGIAYVRAEPSFIASTGEGELLRWSPHGGKSRLAITQWRWDNHIAT